MDTACRATTKDGRRCRGAARASGYCFAHDPDLQQSRQDGQARGGQNKSTVARVTKLMPTSLKPVLTKLMSALDEVHDGSLDPRQGSTMASIASSIGRLYEVAELEQRLERLEAQQHERKSS